MKELHVFGDDAVGAYGYDEKPWFRPHDRLDAFVQALTESQLRDAVVWHPTRAATDEELTRFHTSEHVARVTRQCRANEGALDHGPTPARAAVEVAARHVVGAALDATAAILRGDFQRAFLPIAGFHHARRDEARLYCLYNDPAIVLSTLLNASLGTVAYIDVDIHLGDGVQEGFAAEPRVLVVDLHEDPSTLFPHSPESPGLGPFPGRREQAGEGPARGTKLNIPLAPGTDDATWLRAFTEAEAFLEARRPAFIVFEAGVDGLEDDPLSHQCLSAAAFAEVARRVVRLADRVAGGRLLVLGGGGYAGAASAAAWVGVCEALVSV